jgi:hypothetical protein
VKVVSMQIHAIMYPCPHGSFGEVRRTALVIIVVSTAMYPSELLCTVPFANPQTCTYPASQHNKN